MNQLKGKISFNKCDLSAFLVAQFVHSHEMSGSIPVVFDQKDDGRPLSVVLNITDKSTQEVS